MGFSLAPRSRAPQSTFAQKSCVFHEPDWEAKITLIGGQSGKSVVSRPYLMDKFKRTKLSS